MSDLGFLETVARQAQAAEDLADRPWPLPEGDWQQAQTREDALFAHWRVELAELARLLPPELTLDTFGGEAWLGIVPFRLTGLRLRGLPPVPGLSSFLQLDVRTYVTFDGRPGIWLFSLDTTNPLLVEAAKRAHRLPAYRARMSAERVGDGCATRRFGMVSLSVPATPAVGEPVLAGARDARPLPHPALLPLHGRRRPPLSRRPASAAAATPARGRPRSRR